MALETIRVLLRQLPASPGVYLMKNGAGAVIYVGKATSLRNRVRSYFASGDKLTPKIQNMVAEIRDFEFFITGSEQEALILECNLIKRFRPYYNVRLKDDKGYPYIKINFKEAWPQVYITRSLVDDGARYFGPFASPRSVRQTLKALKGIFQFRSCTKEITGDDARPCLDFHMHRCLGPCIGAVSREEYTEALKQFILFLEGRNSALIRRLDGRMKKAAEELDFERAALLRDQMGAIKEVIEGQKIATRVRGEQDVIAFATDRGGAYTQVFFIRSGKLIGRESFMMQCTGTDTPKEIMTSFVTQFYGSAAHIPPVLVLQHPVADRATIEEWLGSKRKGKVSIRVPDRGGAKELVRLAAENAEQGLQHHRAKVHNSTPALTEALTEVARELHLARPPVRIECYDISNIQGRQAVGSMVVFEKGKPKPAHYRRFRIKTVPAANDYAMLQEVLRRRFRHSASSNSNSPEEDAWAIIPDLVLIDGGKGQLSAAQTAMQEAGAGAVPVAGLAKEEEQLFIPGQSRAIVLPGSSPGLQLLQRVRDEAHRFALGYHQKVRHRETFTSTLDSIPGVGPKRKRALLRRFGSVRGIQEATVEELAAVEGMNQALARKMKETLPSPQGPVPLQTGG